MNWTGWCFTRQHPREGDTALEDPAHGSLLFLLDRPIIPHNLKHLKRSLSLQAESGEARHPLGAPNNLCLVSTEPKKFLMLQSGCIGWWLGQKRVRMAITLDKSWLLCWIWLNFCALNDRNANWCWLELWLPHAPVRQGHQADWEGEIQPSWHVGKTEVWFIMHFSSLHKECFFWYQASWGCAQLLQEGKFQAEPLQSHYRTHVSVHLPATELVFVGAKLRKSKA